MKRYFTRGFFHFLFGFLVIVAAAFSLLAVMAHETPKPVDNVAQPQ